LSLFWLKTGKINYAKPQAISKNLKLTMRSQWECLLQNLGEWQGSFTRLSPQGELLEDIPSETILEGLNNNQTVRRSSVIFQLIKP
jgi:hypothetical protein